MSDLTDSSSIEKDVHGNPFWTCGSPVGKLEITINLAKPEKDPRAIAAAAQTAVGESETCDLCWTPAGSDDPAHLLHSGAPVREVRLGNESWAWWFSPYGYFPEHLIVAAPEHRPMLIDHATIGRLLDFVDVFPQWFIGSNADLPIVGGSILGHDHFQGGGYRFPLMDAPVERRFAIDGLERVQAGIVRWPASVVRLRCADRVAVSEAVCRVMDAWRPFTFEECAIEAFTLQESSAPASARFVRHNTLNPILWREGDDYVMDLVLRNNRITPERPYGLFHVPESLFHIKKENIGLIEIMGRAILPARLAAELPAVRDECSRAFCEILQATGVFKQTPAGRRGWEAFTSSI
ncbi:galactose-1-phosphate uridylyltransferase [Adlercreutzia sp. R25]|uniref:Galactose-1-phosphate uridylyltransferase n=1 Tax=Adlercreutzia shanghongiae TaxID=3111773 RepID=A0ABU6IYE8_9ACTN|nr:MULTISPECIES: galactose-1-phosphate uridylyltransferase [unclassified Adlercreutzia]MEC4271796.1 galactose-1-phosphate uridylyltransferase [Adlercreutzia sp. R25]MEC4294803.1 galactose-1-phosphate uridylyltransferase [Adlercreutzia sp. R22]